MKYYLIFTAFILIVCVLSEVWIFREPINTTKLSKYVGSASSSVTPENVNVPWSDSTKQTETQNSGLDAYYQIIIDNNIFRPLNWIPPERETDYRLLGTLIAVDGRDSRAYIQDRKSEKLHTVSAGQKIGTMLVKSITPKQVVLTQNDKTLMLSMSNHTFLNSRNTHSRSPRTATSTSLKNETSSMTHTTKKEQPTAGEWKKHLSEKAAKIRAERKRLAEYLQQHEGVSGQ